MNARLPLPRSERGRLHGSQAGLPAGTAQCPRCGGEFVCGASDPVPCACTTVTLTAATLAQLRQRYDGCLCMACLRELAREHAHGD
jgi:hypothetical protein